MNRKSIRVSKSKDASPVSGRADKLADGANSRDVTYRITHTYQSIYLSIKQAVFCGGGI